jgi:predicted DCC family thiol-disulfide oxidoreductase YuxK
MNTGWTGGQYSIFRVVFGLYLFVTFARLLPWSAELFSNRGALADASTNPLIRLFPNILALWDSPAVVLALVTAAAGLAIMFALGLRDRVAAIGMWYVLACLLGRNPLISNPSLPLAGWVLLAHALVPPAPYGSLDARGRPDPAGAWAMPKAIHAMAWVLMALGYSYSGYTKLLNPSWIDGTALRHVLESPLARPGLLTEALLLMPDGILRAVTWGSLAFELGFAPLALSRRVRPWLWGLMLGMHLGLLALIDFADLSLGMIMLHLFTFDPAWVGARDPAATETVFYDGHCGLCHRAVRFILAEDRAGSAFRFAPLQSEEFSARVSAAARSNLPDSLVVLTSEGMLLVRSSAVLHILGRLGGAWRVLGALGRAVPTGIRDWVYDGIARIRHRLFAAPPDACPIVPKHLRERFDA